MRFLILICLLLSCQTTPPPRQLDPVETDPCGIADKIGNVVTTAIQKAFACENRGAIKKDVVAKIYQFGLCKETQSSDGLREFICSQLAAQSMKFVVKTTLPERWYCAGGDPAHAIYSYVFNGCMGDLNK